MVKIYRTKALKYIGQLNANQKLSIAQGDFEKPEDLINWFKSQNYMPVIIPDVQDAIEDATKHDEPFKAAWNVYVP